MASRRTLRLKTREQRELEHYRDHDTRPYVRERCSALLQIAAGATPHTVLIRVSERWGKKCFSAFEQPQIRNLRRQRQLDELTVIAPPASPQLRSSAASAASFSRNIGT
jgi:hypothetical protein